MKKLALILCCLWVFSSCATILECPSPLKISDHNIDLLIDMGKEDKEFADFTQELGRLNEKLKTRQLEAEIYEKVRQNPWMYMF